VARDYSNHDRDYTIITSEYFLPRLLLVGGPTKLVPKSVCLTLLSIHCVFEDLRLQQ